MAGGGGAAPVEEATLKLFIDFLKRIGVGGIDDDAAAASSGLATTTSAVMSIVSGGGRWTAPEEGGGAALRLKGSNLSEGFFIVFVMIASIRLLVERTWTG